MKRKSSLSTKEARLEYLRKSRRPKVKKRFTLTLVTEPEYPAPEVEENFTSPAVDNHAPDMEEVFTDLRTRDYTREEIGL